MKLSIGNAITILSIVVCLSGFYYTTQLRLDRIESDIVEMGEQIEKAKKIARKARKPRKP